MYISPHHMNYWLLLPVEENVLLKVMTGRRQIFKNSVSFEKSKFFARSRIQIFFTLQGNVELILF